MKIGRGLKYKTEIYVRKADVLLQADGKCKGNAFERSNYSGFLERE